MSQQPAFALRATAKDAAELLFSGRWCIDATVPPVANLQGQLEKSPFKNITVIPDDEFQWDSHFMTVLFECARDCEARGIKLNTSALPEGAQKLLALATAVKPLAADQGKVSISLAADVAQALGSATKAASAFLQFVGEVSIASIQLIRGRANIRWVDFFYFIELAGPRAIGIVTLISLLVGMILGYLGSVQLKQFGAEIYVANLVVVGMVREMGALMTAVIMAGRTGAAYAAQLGTMQVNEEIDAITTLGISPVEFLVLPRMLALIAVMPLLCIYSDVLGIIGGGLVASGMDISVTQYVAQCRISMEFTDVFTGVFKSLVFGVVIAISGCQAGLQSGRDSAAVGQATTQAVVNAIVYLVVADALINIIYQNLGI